MTADSPIATSCVDHVSLTLLLARAAAGDAFASNEVFALVYQELRGLATHRLKQERTGHTLHATVLVHEAYLRLIGPSGNLRYNSRAHFFHAAARAMRQIIVDHARARSRLKRGRQWRRIPLQELTSLADFGGAETDPADILSLEQAICRLEEQNAELGAVVRLRFFGGLTVEETAEALAISARTVKRKWHFARVWLFREMSDAEGLGTGVPHADGPSLDW
jgi:RNA polymerase sigma-70 factor, ECF subfamily